MVHPGFSPQPGTSLHIPGKEKGWSRRPGGLGEILPMEKKKGMESGVGLWLCSHLSLSTRLQMEGGGLVCPLFPSGRLNPLGFLPSSLVCISLNWFIVSLLC